MKISFLLFFAFFICSSKAYINIEDDNDLCDTCISLVNQLKNILEEPEIQDKIMEGLKAMCDVFPFPFNVECVYSIETYCPEFINLLLQTPTKELCHDFHFCDSTQIPYYYNFKVIKTF